MSERTYTGLDAVLFDIQTALTAGLPWLETAYGRAYQFSGKDISGKAIKTPKCYGTNGEYINVLPEDRLNAQSFFIAKAPEKTVDYSATSGGNHKTRDVSLIIWGNLKRICPGKDYIFTEELKKEVEAVLMQVPGITSVNSYQDEKVEEIFAPFSLSELPDKYLMYPFAGMRFELILNYFDSVC